MSFNSAVNSVSLFAGGFLFSLHPIVYGANLGWNLLNRTCVRCCNDLPDPNLQQEIQNIAGDWLQKQRLQPSFREGTILLAQGVQWSPGSELIIRMPEQLRLSDEPVYRYLLKYQFSKLKYSDVVYSHLAGFLLTAPGAALEFFSNRSLNQLGFAAGVIGTAASHAFRYYIEYRTEEFAIANATDEELKGALALYMAIEEFKHVEGCWNGFTNWYKLFAKRIVSAGGIVNLASPSTASRVQRIISALRARNILVCGESVGERAPLLSPPDVTLHDLDSPEEQARIPTLKGILKVLKIGVEQ